MFRPVKMLKVNVLILDKHLNAITEAMGRMGLIHLVDAVSQSKDHLLDDVDRACDIDELERLASRCQSLLDKLGSNGKPPPEDARALTRDNINALLSQIENELDVETQAIDTLISKSGLLQQQSDSLRQHPIQNTRFAVLRDLSHLYIVTGSMSSAALPELVECLEDRTVILQEPGVSQQENNVIILTSRKNRWSVDSDLGKAGFTKTEIPADIDHTASKECQLIKSKTEAIGQELGKHSTTIRQLSQRWSDSLATIFHQLQNAISVARAQQHFGKAASLFCISGWIPREKVDEVKKIVGEVSQNAGIVEIIQPHQDQRVRAGIDTVPVMFKPNPALRPFQRLITTFGAPRYNDIESSFFVALSFVIMFGIMFGDVGQGAVIALTGLFLSRTKLSSFTAFKDAGYMLLFCGISAAVFGFMYGSVFGSEELLPALWLHPLADVMKLFKAAVAVGIACISIGILINIVNKIRNKRYFEGIFDRFGIIGFLFYWGSLGLGLKATVAGKLTSRDVMFLVVLPLAILFLREPLYNLMTHKKRLLHEDLFSFLLESSIEVMETVTTFLGSTVSFVRIGAFALSHAALCLAIYAIVDILKEIPGSGLWTLLVIATGNLMVIILEGMVVTIQGIRLQYYELFSKYFTGDGVLYAPFQLTQADKQNEEIRNEED